MTIAEKAGQLWLGFRQAGLQIIDTETFEAVENLNAQTVASAVPMRSASTNTINVEDEELIGGRRYQPLPFCF